jgi:pimeloyl-ACP methyl ester carboxylesterase
MPYLDRGGVRLYYVDHGSGPAVLLTHGYTATLRMWDPQVDALADRFRFIRWDLRGHGHSDSPDDPRAYSHDATVADMAALLDACGARRAVVGGLSLGGFMSLEFYLAHPERVAALMLFDTGPGYKKAEGRAQWNQLAESYAVRFERQGLAALGDGSEVRITKHRSAQGLAHAARGILAQRDAAVIESLTHIKVPTLLLAGANDKPFLAGMDYMAAKIPNATMVRIPDAGHAPNLEQPAAFNAAVLSFLNVSLGGGTSPLAR